LCLRYAADFPVGARLGRENVFFNDGIVA